MTTPDAVKAMVEALRANECRPGLHRDQGRCIAGNVACLARAALDAFEKRTPLRDSSALRQVVMSFGSFTMDDVLGLLDALDLALLGERG